MSQINREKNQSEWSIAINPLRPRTTRGSMKLYKKVGPLESVYLDYVDNSCSRLLTADPAYASTIRRCCMYISHTALLFMLFKPKRDIIKPYFEFITELKQNINNRIPATYPFCNYLKYYLFTQRLYNDSL